MQSTSSFFLTLLASTAAAYLTPSPHGKYNVTLATGPLTDYARNDSPAAAPGPRKLMLSVFQPAACAHTVPVPDMPNKTAQYQGPYLEKEFNISFNLSPVFSQACLPVCPNEPDSCSPLDDVPILLFSPGLGIPRLYYNVLASAVASEGFTVITIDSPGDANIITYPDGDTVYANDTILLNAPLAVAPRVADASFVIDQLSNATAMAELLPQRGPRPFPTDRVAMFGHSLGGDASIIAASQDDRIRGAIDWDGTIQKPGLPEAGLDKLVMFMGRAHDNATSFPDWVAAWPMLKSAKLWVNIADSTHESFSDVPTLLQADGQDLAPFVSLLGSIAPAQMVRILTAYTNAWMNGVFAGKEGGPLLEGQETAKFPQVSTVMKGNF